MVDVASSFQVFCLTYGFRNKLSFFGEESLAPRPDPNPEDHHLSVVREERCLHPQRQDAPRCSLKEPLNNGIRQSLKLKLFPRKNALFRMYLTVNKTLICL